MIRIGSRALLVTAILMLIAGCAARHQPEARGTASTSSTGSTESTATVPGAGPCAAPRPAPSRYDSVVVFAFENRSWDQVGMGFSHDMPYLHSLAQQCAYFPQWTETDTGQSSLTQYVGQVTGAKQPRTVGDCSPSSSCSTTADNIFRQLRRTGRLGVDYVEGASAPCSAAGNAAKHVPAMYLWGGDDRAHCAYQVRPLAALELDALPAFAFITPSLCNDGHDCSNAVVDRWARAHIQPVLDSAAYRAGKVAVFVWYDEDHPVPNLWIAPTAASGARSLPAAGFGGTLAAWESMLGLPCLADACTAAGMRFAAHA